jgi:hypothetical protein
VSEHRGVLIYCTYIFENTSLPPFLLFGGGGGFIGQSFIWKIQKRGESAKTQRGNGRRKGEINVKRDKNGDRHEE